MEEKTKTVYIMLIANFCYSKCEVLKSWQSLLKMNMYRIFFAYFPCIINSKLMHVSHTKIGNESFLMVTKVSGISEAAEPLEMGGAVQRYCKMKFYQ